MKKKAIATFLAALMCLSCGTGVFAEEAAQVPEEHMEITISAWDIETKFGSRETDTVLQTIEEKFNVTFVPVNVSWGDFSEKFTLWAASDSLPDIFADDRRYTSTFSEWAREGVIRSIPEDLSAYPNLDKYVNAESSLKASCMVDGEMYCLFRKTFSESAKIVNDDYIFYRWDLAQAAGVESKPTNWQEFRDMMQAIMEADSEGKNIKGLTGGGVGGFNPDLVFNYCAPLATLSGISFKWVQNDDGTYVPAYFAGENLGDDLLPALNLVRDMYTEGTIDADIALTNLDDGLNRFLNGQNAAVMTNGIDYVWRNMFVYWDELNDVPAEEAIGILDVMPDQNGETYYVASNIAWSESYFSSHVDDEKMDRILQIYDYLASEEGALLAACGIEGDTYTINEDNTISVASDLLEKYPSCDMFGNLVAWADYANIDKFTDTYRGISNYADWLQAIMDERVEKAREIVMPEAEEECTSIYLSLDPEVGLTVGEDLMAIMTGTRPVEEMWSEIIDGYMAKGLDGYIEQVNELMNK